MSRHLVRAALLTGAVAIASMGCSPVVVIESGDDPSEAESTLAAGNDAEPSEGPTSDGAVSAGPKWHECTDQIMWFANTVKPEWDEVVEAHEEYPNSSIDQAAVVRFNLEFADALEETETDPECMERQQFTDLLYAAVDLAEAVEKGYLTEDYIPPMTDAMENALPY